MYTLIVGVSLVCTFKRNALSKFKKEILQYGPILTKREKIIKNKQI